MKKYILLLHILFIHFTSFAQWQWAQSSTSGRSWDAGYSIATDAAGNVYVIGSFSSDTISFGSYRLINTGTATDDIFIVKYSSAGTPLWVKHPTGSDYDYGRGITVDAFGSIYITGHYYSPDIIFGNDTLHNTGITDIYTVKYSSAGNVLWARTGGGSGFDESNAITTDAAGNIFVAGQYYSASLTFGTHTITNTDTSSGSLDMFIVKYDSTGNVVWLKSAGGSADDAILSITTDRAENIIVTGSSGSPVCSFGAVSLSNPGITGYNDVFAVKYDNNGTAIWGKRGAGSGFEQGTGVATDTSGNIYVTGNFGSVFIVFENDTLFNVRTIGGPSDIFIVKYSSSGTLLWAKSAGNNFIDVSSGIVTDISGNTYITGYFEDSTITFGNTVLSLSGSSDIFVAEYNSSGNAVSAYSAIGTNTDHSFALSINNNGEVYITGEYYGNAFFGGSSLINSSSGYSDMFIAKLSLATGIQKYISGDENGINIYPNPFTSQTTISFNETQKNTTIRVMNVIGEEMYESKIQNQKSSTIDMSNQAKGIYFVQITDENKNVLNKKIVVE